jgi:hypothetical protein
MIFNKNIELYGRGAEILSAPRTVESGHRRCAAEGADKIQAPKTYDIAA